MQGQDGVLRLDEPRQPLGVRNVVAMYQRLAQQGRGDSRCRNQRPGEEVDQLVFVNRGGHPEVLVHPFLDAIGRAS